MLSLVQERIQYLQELGEFMSSARKSVKDAGERLGWPKPRLVNVSTNQVSTPRPMVTCPLNPGHRVAEDRFQDHLQGCKWRSEGYLEDSIALPDSCVDFGNRPSSTKSIVIDSELAETIIREAAAQDPSMKTGALGTGYRPIPQTSDRLLSDFTTDERRAMYDYVVSQTGGLESGKLEDLQLPFESEKKSAPKTKLEILAEERDAKRRRMSYRSKKVSTNRKSHTEVMREVIENQMHLYETWLKKDEEANEEDNESDLQRPIKQECQDDGYEKFENKGGKKHYNYTSRPNSDQDDRQSQRDSRIVPPRNSYASSTRDKYKQDRLKYTDSRYSRDHHRSRPGDLGRSRSREYYHDYQNESGDRHNHRRGEGEKGYRDKESRSTRDKYYQRDKDKMHRPRSRDRRENSLHKGDRDSKFRNPEGNDGLSTDILHESGAGEVGNKEQKYSQSEEFGIFQDMQRLLDAQVAADVQRESFRSSRSLSNGNEDTVVGTSFESQFTLCKSKDSSDNSDGSSIGHKSRSHKRKKRKKSKHKKKKHRKKSKKKEGSPSSYDSSDSSIFSC